RWYSGAGLYRNVRAVVKNKTHIAKDGVFITTPKISRASAAVCVKTEVASPENAARIVHKIFAQNGEVVASAESARIGGDVFIDIPNPRLWDIKTPELYTMQTSIFDAAGNELDRDTSRFGVRSIEISRKGGFLLNGKKILIKGVCMHHDMGPIGAATNVSALRRQLELLKEMGCNAIRTSHNPPSPELVNLCDEMGILLEDEAFDEWRIEKCKNGYHKFFEKWHEKDLVDFIKRDRNHPSVAMWSIGNEISDQKDPNGGKTARELVDIAHRTDPTRLVTAGINVIKDAFNKSKIAQELDVMGVNYHPSLYGKLAKDYPEMIFHGSETASTVSSRGVYHFPAKRDNNPFHEDYHVTSYDLESPPWAQPPDEEFAALEDNPEFFGEFVWTGFDYLGEPTPYNPGTFARSAYFGIIDLAGFKKDRFYLYQSHWNPGVKVLHVLPHWNWDDRKGEQVPVYCYTNYDKAELFVNGESMGVKSKNPKSKNAYERYRIMWDNVVYKAGEIKVVAYDADGKKRDEKIIKTAGAPRTVRITPERDTHPADPKELIYVAIDVVDKDGNFCPRAARFMFVDVKGEGKLRALCNGDQTDQTPFSSNYMKSFSGKLLAVIEPSGKAGDITVNVYGMKLDPRTITIKTSEPLRVE
ncbi:MAG: DUF4982 domain-containing protein, partial [Opitutales bacterium]|nr:DUF4982 domain-containing protein [Opitutales bacterium]